MNGSTFRLDRHDEPDPNEGEPVDYRTSTRAELDDALRAIGARARTASDVRSARRVVGEGGHHLRESVTNASTTQNPRGN